MRLRSHLLLLTLATLVPLVIFGVTATALIARHERDVFRRGAQERTLAILTALDTELTGHITSLRSLASSERLEAENLRAFYTEAERTLPTQANWRSISLTAASGERLFQTTDPFGAPVPPVRDRASFDAAVRTGQPVIGNLVMDGDRYRIPIRLPVLRDGRARYVLSVLVDPAAVLALLSPQRLPPDWVGVVLDGQQTIVARTIDHDRLIGQPASDSLRAALASGTEGWFQGSTIEGNEVYTPFNTSSFSGWTIAMGIPRAAVESAAARAVWLLAFGTLLAVAAALSLAMAVGRRVSTPILSLASAAAQMGSGAPVTAPTRPGVREVSDVQLALVNASNAIREREHAMRAADRAKDEFLAMLGHELRNPLGAMSSAAALLKLGPQNDRRTTAAVAAIGRQVHHMTRLVDDLLDVGRATSGKIQLSRQPRNLAEVVAGTVGVMRSAGRLNDHQLTVDAAPVWADVDETRTEQIVTNLVGNAIKYTEPGGRIAVRVFRRDGDAVFEVKDDGIGLAPTLLPRVFDLFVQGERTLDRSSGGLGIGLTLVKRLTELHGGRVAAASEGLGRGSCFTVALPAIEAPRAPVAAAANGHQRDCAANARVLLVEDNDDAREMMKAALEHYGYQVFQAANGPAGVQMTAEIEPDAVVIDLGLPGLDGYEVARQLRAMPDGGGRTLIALTGYGHAEARQRAFDAGFDDHLTKPVAPDRLVELIEAGLARDDVA